MSSHPAPVSWSVIANGDAAPAAPTINRTCLNGWWDFQPVFGDPKDGSVDRAAGVPTEGWHAQAVLVPSWWTKPKEAVRRPGETYFTERPDWNFQDDDEFLFDAFGYPVAWARTRAGWLRRTLTVGAAVPGRRRWLRLEALMPRGWIYVNGVEVAYHLHPTLPVEIDIENFLRAGDNEIAVRIADYERDDRVNGHSRAGRTKVPSGNMIPCDHSGIWQDAWLIERGSVRVAEVAIVTSTRRRELTLRWTIANDSADDHVVDLNAAVVHWVRHGDPGAAPLALALPPRAVAVSARSTLAVTCIVPWTDAVWWEPGRPKLYQVRTVLGGCPGESHAERFGFREIWIDGPDLMLNDHPVHLFSDWGHKATPHSCTEGWIRQWFAMMRDGNFNHTRLHTHPHPAIILELADEEGILVTDEAGLHGSSGEQAADEPVYWDNARDHVARFIARDRNHPSVIMWSVGNEMRWNGDRTKATLEQMPKLRRLFNELDPTRPAYHEGDSSLWAEGDQAVISRHYGKECSGLGWWDRKQPLHSGEMSLYHYAGPNNVCHLVGDAGWSDADAVDLAAAEDTALIVEAGRTRGVCAFGPWNISCLQNQRPHPAVVLTWPDWSAPGMKPLKAAAISCEFRYWEGGSGYTPAVGFNVQAHAFRPLAVIDRSPRAGWMLGSRFERTVHVVNDTVAVIEGTLVVQLGSPDGKNHQWRHAVSVARGRSIEVAHASVIPADGVAGRWTYAVQLEVDGIVRDGWTRMILVERPRMAALTANVAVHGDGSSAEAFKALGIQARRVESIDAAALAGIGLLVLERHAVKPASSQHRAVQDFVRAGGRVLILEQEVSLFPRLALEARPVSTAFIRVPGHPVFAGLGDGDLRNWGDDSYAQVTADTLVATRMYRKDDGAGLLPLCDSGEGGFGSGTLEHTPLAVVSEGAGVAVACQFLLTGKTVGHPAAARLLGNILSWLDGWQAVAPATVIEAAVGDDPVSLVARARTGATVLVKNLDAAGITAWARATGVALAPLVVQDTWQMVRVDDALNAGVNDEDACGIENWTYRCFIAGAPAQDFPVGELFLAPVAGLDPLWETPTRACLNELMVRGGRSEPLRAHTRTRFCGAEAPVRAVAMGRVRCGRGQIIVDQFVVPRDGEGRAQRPRLLRPALRLRGNLGVAPETSLFAGESTGAAPANSPGYPVKVWVQEGGIGAATAADQVIATAFNPERIVSRPILHHGAWSEAVAAEGEITCTGAGEHRIYLIIDSMVKRQNLTTNLGIPNPEALTFCDMSGTGTVEFISGGVSHQTITLPGTVTDISFDQGANHVLLRWKGQGGLRLRFRDIMRRAETEFKFMV